MWRGKPSPSRRMRPLRKRLLTSVDFKRCGLRKRIQRKYDVHHAVLECHGHCDIYKDMPTTTTAPTPTPTVTPAVTIPPITNTPTPGESSSTEVITGRVSD